MALAADDVVRSLRGSWHLMTRGAEALKELDLSRDGFWRSFAAFVLLLPAMVAILAAERQIAGLSNAGSLFDSPWLVASVIGAECLAVIAVPLMLIGLVPNLTQSPRLTSFVIAWNWAGIVSASLMAVPATVFAIGWSNPGVATLQALAFASIVLRLRYCVARAAFGADNGIAPLILLASVIADYSVIRLFGLAGF
ncbi:hypothetical protein [Bosea sp. (in: a-proteobacteria)]|jgi:hypothetical protein|uniref:hypothetical protein n=1 Tax=Bosea sp. (in: a-proteobacteria) TaxID=1871050 RepID=UPI003F6F4269